MQEAPVPQSVRDDFARAEELLSRPNPESEPYKFKYEARDVLHSVLARCEGNEPVTAHLMVMLGVIGTDVEEWEVGQKDLEIALDVAKDREVDKKVVLAVLEALNHLGCLWTRRASVEKAHQYLNQAESTYKRFLASKEGCIFSLHDLLDPEAADPTSMEREKKLHLCYANTCHYLAQVLQKTGEGTKAAKYCHITLRKQLDLKEYAPNEWVDNATTLSFYYMASDKFSMAKHLLGAAWHVMDKHRKEMESKEFQDDEDRSSAFEPINLNFGKIDRAWGKMAIMLLENSREMFDQPMQVQDVEEGEDEEDDLGEFPGIEIDEQIKNVSIELAKNFEEARSIFLMGQRHLNLSKNHYTLEDHCGAFVEIQQELSRLHNVLVFFENDPDRKFKIHKRRVEILEKPLKVLNPTYFRDIIRQLDFELGEIHEYMMAAKFDCLGPDDVKPNAQQAKKLNKIIMKGIDHFNAYLDTFRLSETNEMPDKFTLESTRPVLVAYFHLARFWDKLVVQEGSEQELRHKMVMYGYFKRVVNYCDEYQEAADAVEPELPICREFVKLLPVKIERMKLIRQQQQQS